MKERLPNQLTNRTGSAGKYLPRILVKQNENFQQAWKTAVWNFGNIFTREIAFINDVMRPNSLRTNLTAPLKKQQHIIKSTEGKLFYLKGVCHEITNI